MRLETRLLSELKPAPYNPRITLKPGMPEYERLKRSLLEFELVQPLVWNERTGHVVGGHQRLGILQAEGVQDVPVVVVSLTEEREKALNIALNNELVAGNWDVEKLQVVLNDLIELPDFDETLTGFSEKEMRDLLLSPAVDFESEAEEETDSHLTLTLKVDPEEWETFRVDLDELLERYSVTVTVKGLGGRG